MYILFVLICGEKGWEKIKEWGLGLTKLETFGGYNYRTFQSKNYLNNEVAIRFQPTN